MSRETKLTAEVQALVVMKLEDGSSRRHAAQECGVSERTVKVWMSKGGAGTEPYASFREAVLAAEAKAINSASRTVMAAAGEDWKAAAWFLARRAQDEWGDKAKRTLKDQLETILSVVEDVCGPEYAARVYDEIAVRTGGAKSPAAPGTAEQPLH